MIVYLLDLTTSVVIEDYAWWIEDDLGVIERFEHQTIPDTKLTLREVVMQMAVQVMTKPATWAGRHTELVDALFDYEDRCPSTVRRI